MMKMSKELPIYSNGKEYPVCNAHDIDPGIPRVESKLFLIQIAFSMVI
jgi:hypothetical protein